ncbi:MAG: DUF928 domain-containing protein, partial [Planktothrix sp.]
MLKSLFSISLSLKILILSLGLWVIPAPINAEKLTVTPGDIDGGTEDTKPGATRDPCFTSENVKSLTALIPKSEKQLELTISPHPSLLIYFPPSQAETADFVVYNNNTNQLV